MPLSIDPNNPGVAKVMTIGSNNLIEVGARIEGSNVGDYNTIEAKGNKITLSH